MVTIAEILIISVHDSIWIFLSHLTPFWTILILFFSVIMVSILLKTTTSTSILLKPTTTQTSKTPTIQNIRLCDSAQSQKCPTFVSVSVLRRTMHSLYALSPVLFLAVSVIVLSDGVATSACFCPQGCFKRDFQELCCQEICEEAEMKNSVGDCKKLCPHYQQYKHFEQKVSSHHGFSEVAKWISTR